MKKCLLFALCCLLLLVSACSATPQTMELESSPTPVPTPVVTPVPTPAPPEYTIAVLVADAAAPGYLKAKEAMLAAADALARAQNIVVHIDEHNAAGSAQTQMQQAQDVFAAQPGAVLLVLADANAASSYTALAQAGGVPLLFMQTEPVVERYETFMQDANALFVGGLPQDSGEQQGRLLKELYTERPGIDRNGDGILQYVMLMGTPHDTEAIARTHYAVESAVFSGLTLSQLGETYTCNWNAKVAENCMNAALANEEYGSQIEVVFANSDDMALAALKPLQYAGYNTEDGTLHIALIGAGGTAEALAAIEAGTMDATVMPDDAAIGDTALRIALNAAMGLDLLEGTSKTLYADGYSIRIPYIPVR